MFPPRTNASQAVAGFERMRGAPPRHPAKAQSSPALGSSACIGIALPFALFGSAVDHWATIAGLTLLGLALVLATWFYRRLALRIHRSEHQLQSLLEAAPFAIGVTSRETGLFLFANRRAIEVLALAPATYRTQRVPYANADADRQLLLVALQRDGRILDREMELVAFDGRRFPVLGSIAPIEFAGEAALIGTFQDISPLRESELQVRASEARLRALFQTVPDGIVVLDATGCILQASESCAVLLGLPDLARHLGRPVLDFVPEADRPIAREMLAKVSRDQPRETVSYRIARSDGTHVWIEPRAVQIIDPVSAQPRVILVLRNITQRRETQEELAAHAAKLQESIARIAHLQNAILRVCAWTKQVNVDGEWIPIDHYLTKHLGIKVSHGISEKGLEMLGAPPPFPVQPARPTDK